MDEIKLEFQKGFNVVTGETGAGKSVLLGALALLAGSKADKTIIRQEEDACEVEGVIFLQNSNRIDNFLESMDLPRCEENNLVLRRIVSHSKGGRIQINGVLSNRNTLQQLGALWIDFHGPGEPQKLFHEEYQMAMLDSYAGLSPKLEAYKQEFRTWCAFIKEMDRLKGEAQLSESELAYFAQEVRRIDDLNLTTERLARWEYELNRVTRKQDIIKHCQTIETSLMCGSREHHSNGAIIQLSDALKAAKHLNHIFASHGADSMQKGDISLTSRLYERLESVFVELEDIAEEYKGLCESFECESSEIGKIQHKMAQWFEIKRKYGPTLSQVLEKRNAMQKKIDLQSNLEGSLLIMDKEAKQKEEALKVLAEDLKAMRIVKAEALSHKLTPLLIRLGFKHAYFMIEIIDENRLKEWGHSKVRFLFSSNKGQSLLPLNKIASSGETARVMLGLKAILASVDDTPVLVFDEVDANVGGEIGATVGLELKELAQNHQVFCITHLPQVAANGKHHFFVCKEQIENRTTIKISDLDDMERKTELARMLGDRTSQSALQHAETLLKGQTSAEI